MSRHDRGYLKVEGSDIVLEGKPILLKGSGLGGWMNMENFITGYAGHEHEMRAAMLQTLGKERYDYFFDKFLEYFFTKKDAIFLKGLGMNCLRLPVNYRHLQDDMDPKGFKEEGFKHLDRVVELCAKHDIYTIIDLHALPGGQNQAWHCDSGLHRATFWDHKDFQDRGVMIWERIAEHYKDNTWVAGYNPINEPADPEHHRLLAYYDRLEEAVRAVDPHHILFLDGNTYGADFSRFTKTVPNAAYACHDYSVYGFPAAPEPYTGTPRQIEYHEKGFRRKAAFALEHKTPVWVGEWGPVYCNPKDGDGWEQTNAQRFEVVKEQLKIFALNRAHWSIWTYKDIGYQGLVYVSPESAYMKRLEQFLAKKKAVVVDAWGADDTPVKPLFDQIQDWFMANTPSLDEKYPPMWKARRHIFRSIRNILMGGQMAIEYATYFEGLDKPQLDELAKCFAFENCVQRTTLNDILKADM